jgi:hypothetical protein
MLRWIWIIWVTICCLQFCSHTHPNSVNANDWSLEETLGMVIVTKVPSLAPTTIEYTVISGDTLNSIATRYGTTWEKLWDINRDRIANPNIIHVGQRIRIRGAEIVTPPKKQLTKEQKVDKLAKFMFKKAGLEYEDEVTLAYKLQQCRKNLSYSQVFDFDSQRRIMDSYYVMTRQYEIWLLANAIITQTKTEDEFYKMVGLAWQETQFVNRRGKHGEVSFYQFLPSTVKWWHKTDDIGKVTILYELENNPDKATKLALEMLRKNNWNWNWWNHNIKYEYQLNNRIYWFRSEWRK